MESHTSRTLWVYAVMLACSALLLTGIFHLGAGFSPHAMPAVNVVRARAGHDDTLLHVLLALLAVIVASRTLGAVFRRFQQPAVVGEVIAGILLGPSLLGRFWPQAQGFLFPPHIAPLLGVLAQVGVIVFMFLVGLELDTSLLRKKKSSAFAISHASIVVPLLSGGALSLWLYPHLAPDGVRFEVFALFMGVAMSITAFPVLARILTDRGAHRTHLGVLALSCAAVDDVTAWCLLALVVGVAEAHAESALLTALCTAAYMGALYVVARPLVHRAIRRIEVQQRVSREAVAAVLVALIVSAIVTEAIGIHAIFGAFLVGALIPHDTLLARALRERLEDLVMVLLLPAFFAFTGLRTELGLLSSASAWMMCGAIVLVACAGKVGGTFVVARLTGVPRREALSLGVLMNTRGLVELVVLNIGLDLGVISPPLFAMMVVMALVTTFATAPLVSLLSAREVSAPESAATTAP